MPGSIAIITNEFNSKIDDSRYFLAQMVKIWKQQGIVIHKLLPAQKLLDSANEIYTFE